MRGKIGNWQLFEDENKNEIELEKSRQSHEERMRYYKLCDEMGLIYEDIEKFVKWLKQPTIEQIERYNKQYKRYREIFDTDVICNLSAKTNEIDNEINATEEMYWKDKDEYNILSAELDDLYDELKDDFSDNANKKISNLEKQLKKLENNINENEKKIDTLRDLSFETDNKMLEASEKRHKELSGNKEYIEINRKVVKFSRALSGDDGAFSENEEQFNEFRKNHYNADVERLFRQLRIDYLKGITNEEIVNRGSIEDYRNFMENIIFSFDKLYFDNYDMYLENKNIKIL